MNIAWPPYSKILRYLFLVWWARATMAAKAAEASPRRDPKELAICGHRVRGVDGGSAVDRLSHAARSLNARL